MVDLSAFTIFRIRSLGSVNVNDTTLLRELTCRFSTASANRLGGLNELSNWTSPGSHLPWIIKLK